MSSPVVSVVSVVSDPPSTTRRSARPRRAGAAMVLGLALLAGACGDGGGRVLPPPTTGDATRGTALDGDTGDDGTTDARAAADEAGGNDGDPTGADEQASTDGVDPTAPAPPSTTTTTTTTTYVGQEYDDTSPNTAPPIPAEGGCDPGYAGACVPPPPARVTCADLVERNILVTGSDPHGLDPDADGTACPSELPPATDPPAEPLD